LEADNPALRKKRLIANDLGDLRDREAAAA
jgi:hypothetical protein